jgi:hypothetical protein
MSAWWIYRKGVVEYWTMFLASVTRVIIVLELHFQVLLLLKKICTCILLILNVFTLRFELQSHVVTVESEDRMPQIRNGTIIDRG